MFGVEQELNGYIDSHPEFYKVSIDYLVGLTDDPTPYPRKK